MNDTTDMAWHLDKRVPLALILAISLQSAGMIWWAAQLDGRVRHLEVASSAASDINARLIRVEVQLANQTETLDRIDRRVEKFTERRR